MSPFFKLDPILPYTFMTLLTQSQVINLLKCSDMIATFQLPLDSVLAIARENIKSRNHRVIIDRFSFYTFSTRDIRAWPI